MFKKFHLSLKERKTVIGPVRRDVRESYIIYCNFHEAIIYVRERFESTLPYQAAGFASLIALVRALPDVAGVRRPDPVGDWLLYDAERPPPPAPRPPPPPPVVPPAAVRPLDEDALPGVPYEAGVFPADCVQPGESIPRLSLVEERVRPRDSLVVRAAEVYSPSHFWLLLADEEHYDALDRLMDDMNEYYEGEGRDRRLSVGALTVGHHCSGRYQRDWHRSVIVAVLDSDHVKVTARYLYRVF